MGAGKWKNGFKKVGKVWHYRFRLHGNPYEGSTFCGDMESAKLYVMKIKSELALESVDVRKRVKATFGECVTFYLENKGPFISDNTRKKIESLSKTHWVDLMGVRLNALQPSIGELYRNLIQKVSKNSVRSILSYTKSVIEFCRTQGQHSFAVNFPTIKEDPITRFAFTREEATEFLEKVDHFAVHPHQKVMVRVALLMGLRRSEVLKMEWSRFDEGAGTYTVLGKGAKTVELPVPDDLMPWLVALKATAPKTQLMFPGKGVEGEHSSAFLSGVIKTAGAACGFGKRVTPHTLRRSFVTILLQDEVELHLTQKLARHSNPAITASHYYCESLGGLRAATNRLKVEPKPEPADNIVQLKAQ